MNTIIMKAVLASEDPLQELGGLCGQTLRSRVLSGSQQLILPPDVSLGMTCDSVPVSFEELVGKFPLS